MRRWISLFVACTFLVAVGCTGATPAGSTRSPIESARPTPRSPMPPGSAGPPPPLDPVPPPEPAEATTPATSGGPP